MRNPSGTVRLCDVYEAYPNDLLRVLERVPKLPCVGTHQLQRAGFLIEPRRRVQEYDLGLRNDPRREPKNLQGLHKSERYAPGCGRSTRLDEVIEIGPPRSSRIPTHHALHSLNASYNASYPQRPNDSPYTAA